MRRLYKQALYGVGIGLGAILTLSGCGTKPIAAPAPSTNVQSGGFKESATASDRAQRWSHPPAMSINVHKHYVAKVYTTYGMFTLSLFAKQSPHTVNNFVFLALHHFYNGDKFFRIIAPYMVQTGDPDQNGTGGPGYEFADELPPPYSYAPGIVAMANAGPNTNGSQFFICTGPEAAQILDSQPNYTQFARVISGMNVVERIAHVPVTTNPQSQEQSDPTKNVYIERIVIQVSHPVTVRKTSPASSS